MMEEGDWRGMFWRFYPAGEDGRRPVGNRAAPVQPDRVGGVGGSGDRGSGCVALAQTVA